MSKLSSDPFDQTTELDLTGEYYIFEETLPRGFQDFDHLEISTHEYVTTDDTADVWIPIPPKGSLKTKRSFMFALVSVSQDFVTFETASIDGVYYRFTGKYRHDPRDEQYGTIQGTLTKLENRRVTATMVVTFIPGGC